MADRAGRSSALKKGDLVEESKQPRRAANTLFINTAEQYELGQPTTTQELFDDIGAAALGATRTLSPKLVPYKKHSSFSSSDRSSDSYTFRSKNQEAS